MLFQVEMEVRLPHDMAVTEHYCVLHDFPLFHDQGALEAARPYYEKAKSTEIGNTVGLEALHRLEAIKAALGKQDVSPQQE